MRARSALLFVVPLLAACGAQQGDPLGTAEDAITVCATGTPLEGIDVSSYDGTINWAQVKASGRAFAFAKATEGVTVTDSTFATNWAAMKQAGVVRGAYCFFHSNDDPVAEANYFLKVMGTLQPGDLPPTLDLEVTDNESAATVTANAITWLDTVAAATGTKPILYASPSFVTGTLGSPAGLENHAQLWVANWGVSCPDVPAPFTAWPFWQYSATVTVPGVPGSAGACDVDRFDGDLAALQALTVGGSSSSSGASSTSSSSSTSSGTPPPTCQVNGVDGTCINTAVCATMAGYVSTPGYCPGPASEECCTSTGGGSSSSTSSSTSGSSSSTSSSSGTSGASSTSTSGGGAGGGATSSSSSGGTGSAGAGGASGSSGGSGGTGAGRSFGSNNASSGCSAAATGGDAGSAARAWLVLALAAFAGRRRGARR